MKYIYCLIFAVGIALFVGTAGGSDCGLLTIGEIVGMVAGSFALVCLGWNGMFEAGQ